MEKFIVITGGELSNKGAESMTYVAVSEIKKRLPNHKIILLSASDYKRDPEELDIFNFDVLPFNTGVAANLIGGLYSLSWKVIGGITKKNSYSDETAKLKNILSKTDFILDISGYHLSSQGGVISSLTFLSRIMLAEKFDIPIYLMPQSFGPFEYSNSLANSFMNYMIKKHLPYPSKIFAREKEGYNLLLDYNLKNVEFSYDLVLSNKSIDKSSIFKETQPISNFNNISGIAIVPNMRNFEFGDKEEIIKVYEQLIYKLFEYDKDIYLLRHSKQDLEACELIKEKFKDNQKVKLISQDLSCLEFDELVKRFDFIIGSRFHSIVHAYKNSVPAIALGWATKYHELLGTFDQSEYIFDVRGGINVEAMTKAIDKINRNYPDESKKIGEKLLEVQAQNVFDVLNDKVRD